MKYGTFTYNHDEQKTSTPFDLSPYSQLTDVEGTAPTTTDLRQDNYPGTQREWGAFEYKPLEVGGPFFESGTTTKLITPFDLSSDSQLIDVAGTSPTATDIRGEAGTVREWGALEYDSALLILTIASSREVTYGEEVLTTQLWAIEVDWDKDDVFDGSNEATYAYYFESNRGRDYYIKAKADGFQKMPIGEAVVKLYNDTGRYDPYNSDSDLYGLLKAGCKVRITVKNGTAGDVEPVFSGILKTIIPYGRRGTVDLIIKDGWDYLQNADVRAAIQSDVTADEAIQNVLDYVSYPSIWGSALDVAPDTINYWWGPKVKAKGEIESLSESGMGYVFVAKDGTLTYYSRHNDFSSAETLTEDELLKDISISQPGEFTRNIIGIKAHPNVLQALQVMWTLNEIPKIEAGKSYTVWSTYKYNDIEVPAVDVVTPLASTDFTCNAQEDGGGADLTANFTVSFTDFGETSKTVLTNGGADAYLTLLQIRGKPIESPDIAEMVGEGDDYDTDPKAFNLDLEWLQDTGVAQDMATFLAGFLSAEPIFPRAFIEDRPTIQFPLELFDMVTLDLTTWGIDSTFMVSKIKHKWLNRTGQLVRTEFKFEPAYTEGGGTYWRIGVHLLGVGTIMGW